MAYVSTKIQTSNYTMSFPEELMACQSYRPFHAKYIEKRNEE